MDIDEVRFKTLLLAQSELSNYKKATRQWTDVSCEKAYQCFNGCRYGKGCYEDDLNNAMGGKPWQECHCMTTEERLNITSKGK